LDTDDGDDTSQDESSSDNDDQSDSSSSDDSSSSRQKRTDGRNAYVTTADQLQALGLAIEVLDENQNPVNNANLNLTIDNGSSMSKQTDSDGIVKIAVPDQKFLLQYEAENQNSQADGNGSAKSESSNDQDNAKGSGDDGAGQGDSSSESSSDNSPQDNGTNGTDS
jgi:hypothetical protein